MTEPAKNLDHVNGKRSLEEEAGETGVQNYDVRKKSKKGNRREEDVLDPGSCGTSYYFSGHLRKVYPYFYEFKTFCKGRWLKRKLREVLDTEFRSLQPEQLANDIRSGVIRVNGSVVDIDYVLRGNEHITNRTHRHELPVLAAPIRIIHEDDDLVVIDKPPSIPVHACGRYRFNTVVSIMQTETGVELHPIHRLDRMTSGVLLLGKSHVAAQKMQSLMSGRMVQKEYLCRVVGDFPSGEVTVNQPLDVLCPRIGATIVSSSGKESVTIFKRISFNGKSSLVHCFPKTGRTHQIRVHLQFLGHAIINDYLYNSVAFGSKVGKDGDYDGMSREQLLASIRKAHLVYDWIIPETENQTAVPTEAGDHDEEIASYLGPGFEEKTPAFDESKVTRSENCTDCKQRFRDPSARYLMQFLHAWKYAGPDWAYESERPFWAKDDFSLL